ncbi:MAG: PD40 domain-containing protein [Chloracidobacterium sp.]|nr:PD40 domain-containing protein [Chloracidobacterium sp.]
MFIHILFNFVLIQLAFGSGTQEVSVVYGHVAWSPDGKYICFTRSEVTNTTPRRMRSDLYISRPDGSEMRKLTGDNGNESFPSWSKDGKTIYFGSGAPGSSEQDIYSIGTDGKGLRLIARAPGRDGAPVVSPNGRKIVFNSTRDGGLPQIYVMNNDGTEIRGGCLTT